MLHGLHGVSGKSPKDEAEFCQVPPVVAVLVKQLLLPLLEQLDGLLALPLQVLDEDLEVLVRVQQVQLVLQIWLLPWHFWSDQEPWPNFSKLGLHKRSHKKGSPAHIWNRSAVGADMCQGGCQGWTGGCSSSWALDSGTALPPLDNILATIQSFLL